MFKKLIAVLILFVAFTSCKKELDKVNLSPLSTYFPLEVGHYIDYDLDSTVFEVFGQVRVEKHFEAREIVQETLTDGEGNDSYRIDRYIRKNSSDAWQPSISYIVTPHGGRMEVVENNLRYIRLILPFSLEAKWKGNSYIDTKTIEQDLRFMDGWDYQYDSIGMPLNVGELSFDNTIKVFQRDETIGSDPTIPSTTYGERTFAYEKYAEGVGLIEREFLHWVYQGAVPGRLAFYNGYGIRMKIKAFGKM